MEKFVFVYCNTVYSLNDYLINLMKNFGKNNNFAIIRENIVNYNVIVLKAILKI